MTGFLDATFGPVVEPDKLTRDALIEIYRYVSQAREVGARFVEARIEPVDRAPFESIVLDVQFDRVQRPAYPLGDVERIVVRVGPSGWPPTAFAARDDFPLVPHMNEVAPGEPKSLCLYDQAPADLRITWTAGSYVQRIRWWLEKTAEGTLHDVEQPLEPFFFNEDGLKVLAARQLVTDIYANADNGVSVSSFFLTDSASNTIILKSDGNPSAYLQQVSDKFRFVVLPVRCDVQTHGRIRSAPRRLSDLHDILLPLGVDLLALVRSRFRAWGTEPAIINRRLAILVEVPLRRVDKEDPENLQLRAFITQEPIGAVGESLGLYVTGPDDEQLLKNILARRVPEDLTPTGGDIAVVPAAFGFDFDKIEAATLSGSSAIASKCCLLGAGSLGSALLEDLVRRGFGAWTVVDHDRLEPHNLARHVLSRSELGRLKAEALAERYNALLDDPAAAQALAADILTKSGKRETEGVLAEAALAIDATASAAVLRSLARDFANPSARLGSIYLIGNADALVLLMQDEKAVHRLDDLEAILIRAGTQDTRIGVILSRRPERRATLGSCRSPTNRTAWSTITMLSAIATHRVVGYAADPAASITVIDAHAGHPEVVELAIPEMHEMSCGDWTVVAPADLMSEMDDARSVALPSETGGALFGTYDAQHKRIYVLAQLSGFPDDEGSPSGFARGRSGLKERMEQLHTLTGAAVSYLGEWHSHPNGASLRLSDDDKRQLVRLCDILQLESRPALSVVLGAKRGEFYLGDAII